MYAKTNFIPYQTFENVPTNKPTIEQKKRLAKNLSQTKEAETAVMLILEHAKIHNSLLELGKLPYDIQQEADDCIINVENLPNELIWILTKFFEVAGKI